jgi:hypothetical protein
MTRTLACCLLLGVALPSAAAEPEAFRCHKEIDRSAVKAESILAIALDSDVYSAARPAFPDLRIFDSQGKETPYLIEKATEPRTHTVRTTCGSKAISLHEQEDGLDVIVRLDKRAPNTDGLSIVTPLTNYERRVSVFGSDDGEDWTPLVAGGLVFDYSRYMDIGNREIRLPKNGYRQFKVSIAGIADANESPFLDLTRKYRGGSEAERTERTMLERRPFRIDRIELWHETREKLSESQRKADYPVAQWRVEQDAAEKTTIIHVAVRREPLTEFILETSSRNFSRAIEVQKPVTRGVRVEWLDIARGRASLVDFGGYRRENLGISFPEQRETDYRIVVHNEDNPPLAITGVTARGDVYRAVFLAAENENYRLGYGSDEADPPKYDAAAVLGPLREGRAASEVRLGAEVPNPAAGEPPALTLRTLVNNPVFLGTVVVVLAAALAWALFRAARRINELPRE